MEKAMDQAYGTADWRGKLNLLWSEAEDDHEKAWMRTAYMNAVSRKVEECFFETIGGLVRGSWSGVYRSHAGGLPIPMQIWDARLPIES